MKLGPVARLFHRTPRFIRASARHACEIDSSLMLIDRMVSFEGRVIDISQGGAMFRPKLAYIMYRRDVPVCLGIGGEEIFGQIVNTAPAGFSIRFDDVLEEADMLDLIARHGNPLMAAA